MCSIKMLLVLMVAGQAASQASGRKIAAPRRNTCARWRKMRDLGTLRSDSQKPGRPNFLIPIHEMDDSMVDHFMSDQPHVEKLTKCFENLGGCKSMESINLICQVQQLGLNGNCAKCTPSQQTYLHKMVYRFISEFSKSYPDQFKRILPHIPTILGSGK